MSPARRLGLDAFAPLAAVVAVALAMVVPARTAEAAPLRLERAVIVGRVAADAPWRDGPTAARRAADAGLAVVAIGRDGKRRVVIADDDVTPLIIGGRAVAAAERRPWSALGAIAVRWSTVEPHAWRPDGVPASNGATTAFHSNVSTDPADFGRWLGYDQLVYFETVVADWSTTDAARQRPASARPPRAEDDVWDGLGTLRYRVDVRLPDGRQLATPGADAVDRFGILPGVHRVSIRAGDDFVGHLASYFMVPEVFGSAGGGASHQTERFTGADCADVLVGALRRSGRRDVGYTNVAGLPALARSIADPVVVDDAGHPTTPIRGVKVGDLIRIDYGGALTGHTPRGWDHVAVLWADRSDPDGPQRGAADGELDGFDLVVHMGHPRLVLEPLSGQTPATIDVLRWRDKRGR